MKKVDYVYMLPVSAFFKNFKVMVDYKNQLKNEYTDVLSKSSDNTLPIGYVKERVTYLEAELVKARDRVARLYAYISHQYPGVDANNIPSFVDIFTNVLNLPTDKIEFTNVQTKGHSYYCLPVKSVLMLYMGNSQFEDELFAHQFMSTIISFDYTVLSDLFLDKTDKVIYSSLEYNQANGITPFACNVILITMQY